MSEPPHAPLEYATPLPRSRRRLGLFITLLVLVFLLGVAVPVVVFITRTTRYTAVGYVTVAPPTNLVQKPTTNAPTAPSRVTLVQRTRQPLPGTNGTIVARIGDITGGQTLLTVDDINGQQLIPPTSVREGDTQRFKVGTAAFDLELVELKNFLTGDDFAVFALRQAGTALSEDEKIKRLIDAVATEPGVTFIRNGTAHGGADAAAHLNRKYQAVRDKRLTARQFVEHVASRSSMSGQPYRVKLPDGTEQPAEQWFAARLREIDGSGGTTQPDQ